jgi:hypothetical protein
MPIPPSPTRARRRAFLLAAMLLLLLRPNPTAAQDAQADLAKQLQNPVASLISVPLQHNLDFGIGPNDATRYLLNVQPVIPISLSEEWNLISRTILPVVYQGELTEGAGSTFGLGDIVQSLFLSPNKTEPFIWGAGPVFLLPTATDDLLGAKKWGVGPTFVVLKQQGGWTYGALGNHIWSFAGDEDRADISNTFLQPFLTYTWPSTLSVGGNLETTYDWNAEQWTIPLNLFFSRLVTLGTQPVSLGGGVRFYLEKPDGGPDWGLRLNVVLLFPK